MRGGRRKAEEGRSATEPTGSLAPGNVDTDRGSQKWRARQGASLNISVYPKSDPLHAPPPTRVENYRMEKSRPLGKRSFFQGELGPPSPESF